MWDLPGPGIEPVSLALAGGFFTTEPPGKPWKRCFSFGRRDKLCRMTVALKEMSLFFSCLVIVCACFWEWEGREGGSAPEPAEGSWFFSELAQWGWGVFRLDAVESSQDHRVHPLERPGQWSWERLWSSHMLYHQPCWFQGLEVRMVMVAKLGSVRMRGWGLWKAGVLGRGEDFLLRFEK